MIEKYTTESHLRLKFMRELFQLKRNCFAALLGVKYRTYNEWEKYNILPSVTAIHKMIKIGLNPNYLQGEDNMFLIGYTYNDVKQHINQLAKGEKI